VSDGDQFGEPFVGGLVAVPPAAGVLVEKLREALGAPPVQPTVATMPMAAKAVRGRTRTNA
jgi:hypothetical protein